MARTPVSVAPSAPAPGPVGGAFAPARLDVSPDMFGGGTARAAGEFGQTLQQAGQVVTQQIIQDKIIENETEATNANNAYQEEAARLWGEFSSLQGQEAVDALPRFQEQMRGLRDRYVTGASNPAVRRQLNRSIGGAAAGMLGQAGQQNGRNVRMAGDTAQQSAGNNAINEGVRTRDNPQEVAGALQRGLVSVETRGRLLGWDTATLESQRAEYRGRFYSAVIATTAENDPLRAQQIFEANRDNMDAQSQIRIENFLRAPVRTRRAADIVQEVTRPPGAPAGGAPAAPGTPMNRQGGTPGAADDNPVRAQVARAEGGTDAQGQPIQNRAGSSAYGPLQITRDTWNAYAERLGLQRDVEGQTPPANRGDRATQNRIWDAFQADARRDIGRDLTPREQYTAWFLGISGAKAFIMADPNADAQQVYRGVAGPRIADQAFRQNGALLRPGLTVGQALQNIGNYFDRHGGGGRTEGVQPRARDEQMREALTRAGTDPELRAAVLSQLRQQWGVDDAMNASERSRMDRRIEETGRALALGTNTPIPEADIRRLYQPEQAAQILDQLATRQIEGDVFRSVQLATPQQIAEMQAGLASGSGPVVQQLRERRGTVMNPDGSVSDEDAAGDAVARAAIGETFRRAVEARGAALTADPAQYVQADPAVRMAAEAQRNNPSDPAAMTAYAQATLDAQARLGVPEQNRRIMSVQNAAALAGQIARADPGAAEGSMGVQLNGLRRLYGAEWPRVFGELVRNGLPAEFQVLANIPSDAARADYQRALFGMRQRGGIQQYSQAVPDRERQAIDRDIDTRLEAFRTSVFAGQQVGAADVFATYRDGVRLLSMYYALNGMTGSAAVQTAVARVLNDKYEFSGTARVPRTLNDGTPVGMARVQQSINLTMRNLRPDDLVAPESRDPSLSEEQRRQNMWGVAQRGVWVPNADDSGLVLMGQWEHGNRIPVRRRDGSVVEMRFNALPQADTSMPGTSPRARAGNPGRSMVGRIDGWDAEQGTQPPATAGDLPLPPVPPPGNRPPVESIPVDPNAPVPGTRETRVGGQPTRPGRWVAPGVE